MLETIEKSLSQEDIAFAKKQLAVYQELYEDINEVYASIYRIDLPQNPFYSPIARSVDENTSEISFFSPSFRLRSVTARGLKSRVETTAPLKDIHDMQIFQLHLKEMAHFIAFAEKMQVFNGVFKDRALRDDIQKVHGKEFLRVIDAYLELFVNNGRRHPDILASLVNLLNRSFVLSVLGGKVSLKGDLTVP